MKSTWTSTLAAALVTFACRDRTPSSARTALPIDRVGSDARVVCDSVVARWRAVRFAVVALRDTVAGPSNRNSVEPTRPEEPLPPTAACVVVARTDSGLADDQRTPYWPAPDWAPLWMFSADGPDGRMLNYQRGMVRCQVEDSFDGGDDSDTTVVPLKWFAQRTTCWHHNRALLPTDTGRPP